MNSIAVNIEPLWGGKGASHCVHGHTTHSHKVYIICHLSSLYKRFLSSSGREETESFSLKRFYQYHQRIDV